MEMATFCVVVALHIYAVKESVEEHSRSHFLTVYSAGTDGFGGTAAGDAEASETKGKKKRGVKQFYSRFKKKRRQNGKILLINGTVQSAVAKCDERRTCYLIGRRRVWRHHLGSPSGATEAPIGT